MFVSRRFQGIGRTLDQHVVEMLVKTRFDDQKFCHFKSFENLSFVSRLLNRAHPYIA